MGLKKLIKEQEGVEGDYISIESVAYTKSGKTMSVVFQIHYNKTQKDAGDAAIFRFPKRFDNFDLSKMIDKDPYAAVYTAVKLDLANTLQYDLTGATDV